MSRWTGLSLLLLSGCIVVRTTGPNTDDPIVADPCDQDEIFGDGVDQDCDGTVDVKVDTWDAPARTDTLTLQWSNDLRALGGVIELPTGTLSAQELTFDEGFGGDVILKERSDYAQAQGWVRAHRVDLDGPVDLVADGATLTAFRPEGSTGTAAWSGDWPADAGPDALVTEDGVWALGCDGAAATFERLDLELGSSLQSGTVDTPATDCVMLGEADGLPVVVLTVGGALERWVLDPSSGFTDRLVLASAEEGTSVKTATSGGVSVLAYLDDGDVRVLNNRGEGLILGDGTAAGPFAVGLDPQGDLLTAWTDADGTIWAALGSPPGPVTSVALAPVEGAEALAVGLNNDELAIAVQQDSALTFLRALR